jgi:hypothetical protein
MLDRHDSDMMIIARLLEDEKFDWLHKINSITWHYSNIIGKDVELYSINANGATSSVLSLVMYYMKRHMGE